METVRGTQQLEAHNITNRSIAIKKRAKTERDATFKNELNAIANQVQQSMLSAEKKCAKLRTRYNNQC
jgi:flagellar hook-basal body complex protein FliE